MPGRTSPLLRQLAAAIAPGVPIEHGMGDAAIARDGALLAEVMAGAAVGPTIRLWTNRQCLVTTRRFAAHPRFAQARAISAAAGWPVYVRSSGGTTVAHRPGILNVSLAMRAPHDVMDVARSYEPLVTRLIHAFRNLGLETATGACRGSYCDGTFNVTSGGRKIAGTASAIRRAGTNIFWLSHAVIWVEGDPAADIAAVTRFEQALGYRQAYDPAAHTTLARELAASSASLPVSVASSPSSR